MRPFFNSEAQMLRRFADAAPGHGAFPLLGAPLLAVIAIFLVQPRASGFEPDAPSASGPQVQAAANTSPAEAPEAYPVSYATGEVLQAIEARDALRARTLLAQLSADDLREDGKALRLMLECVETPSNQVMANAYRYYLERAPESLRQPLYAVCLARPQ